MTHTPEITEAVAWRVLDTVDAGLSEGVGEPVPGKMCVEAAVCFALGLPHGDDPGCVDPVLRSLKIGVNDGNWSSRYARALGLRRLALAQLGSRDTIDSDRLLRHLLRAMARCMAPRVLRALFCAPLPSGTVEAPELSWRRSEAESVAAELGKVTWRIDRPLRDQSSAQAVHALLMRAVRLFHDGMTSRYAFTTLAMTVWELKYKRPVTGSRLIQILDEFCRAADRDALRAWFAEEAVQGLDRMRAPGCEWLRLAPLTGEQRAMARAPLTLMPSP